jgi:hypothetical protein
MVNLNSNDFRIIQFHGLSHQKYRIDKRYQTKVKGSVRNIHRKTKFSSRFEFRS